MDGYAVRASDTRGVGAVAGELRVVGELRGRAWRRPFAVGAGEAIRIMTGAPMPAGADSVVMVERTRVGGDNA